MWRRLAQRKKEVIFDPEEKIHAKCEKSMVAWDKNHHRVAVCGTVGRSCWVREPDRGRPQEIRRRLCELFAVVFVDTVFWKQDDEKSGRIIPGRIFLCGEQRIGGFLAHGQGGAGNGAWKAQASVQGQEVRPR